MNTFSRIAKIYLLVIICFFSGIFVARNETFPWQFIGPTYSAVQAFIAGDATETSNLVDKLQNDLGGVPARWFRRFKPANPQNFQSLDLMGKQDRRDNPRIWISPNAPDSYRLLVGALDITGSLWGGILLDPLGNIIHQWEMNGEIEGLDYQPDVLKNLYGVDFFPDGSTSFSMQENAGGLIKRDVCSQKQWVKPGAFHHVVSPTEDRSAFWTFQGLQGDLHPILTLVDAQNGETMRQIDMALVQKANPEKLIFDLRYTESFNGTHPNDIDPLPTSLAPAFPQFNAGDLLISYKTTNLIFVLDPNSLEVKWWYFGAGDAQHDPDWQKDGSITIFNNNKRAARRAADLYSEIVSIDPNSNSHNVIIDGADFDFYSQFNGHHEITENGTALITSSMQGRVFEVDLKTGKLLFEFVNAYNWDNGDTLHMAEALTINEETAKRWASHKCAE